MLLKPQLEDLKVILYHIGKISILLGLFMFLPLFVGILYSETQAILDFSISIVFSFIFGFFLILFFKTETEIHFNHAMVIVSLSWILAMFLGAIPLYLSGHFSSFLDSCFEAMSGFATTGLTLAQDLDHLANSYNFWRHLTMFIGGIGIIVIALSFLITSSAYIRMYIGEARDEKILPNIVSTARFILYISIVYFIVGTLSLTIVGLIEGLTLKSAILNGACLFMAAFNTGGFTIYSQNILYYHSILFEILTCVFMLLGAINFKLQYTILVSEKKELFRDIEIKTLFFSIIITFTILGIALRLDNLYPNSLSFFRKGFYQLISAHTGTGYSNIYSPQFLSWNNLAIFGIIVAMAIGGCSCSTTGAIKTIRIGLLYKGLAEDIKKIILPESSIVNERFHHINDIILEDKHLRSASVIIICYIALYFFGAIVGMFFGYPFLNSLFESTSAAGNVGLSCGITSPDMPSFLKITYIIQMWAGRLEFISVFTLFGFIWSIIKGKR